METKIEIGIPTKKEIMTDLKICLKKVIGWLRDLKILIKKVKGSEIKILIKREKAMG